MRSIGLAGLLLLLGGSAAAKPVWRPPPPRVDGVELGARLEEAIRKRDATSVEKLLGDAIAHDGLWLAGCEAEFAKQATIDRAKVRGLAKCLAKQKLLASTRRSAKTGGAILTFEPGIEIEIVFATNQRAKWIGALWPRDADRGTPTLTVQAFESLRTAGTTLLDDAIGKKLTSPSSAWLKICLDKTGAIASRRFIEASPVAAGEVFLAAIEDWKFRPFTHRKTAMPVCSLTYVSFPASSAPPIETVPAMPLPDDDFEPVLKTLDFTGVGLDGAPPPPPAPPQNIPPSLLEAQRIAGNKNITPNGVTIGAIVKSKKDKVVGSWKLCVDPTGAVQSISMLKSTGFSDYDTTIQREMRMWRYRPYLVNGKPAPVCTAVTFIYTVKQP